MSNVKPLATTSRNVKSYVAQGSQVVELVLLVPRADQKGLSEQRCKWLDTPTGWLARRGH
jgi:hypothetical protein